MAGPLIDSYAWNGGREAMMRFGPQDGPVAVVALPLFEEANRTRGFAVAILRALVARGVGGLLPELPGTGESLIETHAARLSAMRSGYAAAASGVARPFGLAIRSGALLGTAARLVGQWHLSPQDGSSLLRELGRITPLPASPSEPVEVAGNLIAPEMLAELASASTVAGERTRTVRLTGDPRGADAVLPGPPLWRRAEPDSDPALVQAVADDFADWVARCGG